MRGTEVSYFIWNSEKFFFLVMEKFFIFAKVSLQGKFYDTESKRDDLLEWFDFWTTFLRDEINLPL